MGSDESWQRKRLFLSVLEEPCGVQAAENVAAVSGEALGYVFLVVGAGSADAEAVGDVVFVVDAAKGSGGGVGSAGEGAQQRGESAAPLGKGAERHEQMTQVRWDGPGRASGQQDCGGVGGQVGGEDADDAPPASGDDAEGDQAGVSEVGTAIGELHRAVNLVAVAGGTSLAPLVE